MEDSAREDIHEEGTALIFSAFGAARDAGVDDWHQMRSAVLKNRILDATSRKFDERRWGVESFGRFLDLFPELVHVDRSVRPPLVTLIRQTLTEDSAAPVPPDRLIQRRAAHDRVRTDLWWAVMNFDREVASIWEPATGTVRQVLREETSPDDLVLPAVDTPTFTQWRAEFAEAFLEAAPDSLGDATRTWRNEGLPSTRLPTAVRRLWNEELKRRVRLRLEEWYADHDLTPPDDLVETAPRRTTSDETDRLRASIIHVVRRMTRAELDALELPAAAVFRRSP